MTFVRREQTGETFIIHTNQERITNMQKIIPDDIVELTKMFTENHFELYLVGGCVRDFIMNTKPHDWDMCTNATPKQVLTLAEAYGLKCFTTGMPYGTIQVIINDKIYEITTYRTETSYSDGRHPDSIKFASDLTTDLSRRDFTINAIAMNPVTRCIADPYAGSVDIIYRRLCAVGNPDERLKEDALRILRALRFAIRYDMIINTDLAAAIHRNKDLLSADAGCVSRERVTDELVKIFAAGKPIARIFTEYRDVIAVLFPEIEKTFDFSQNNKYHRHNVYEHMLAVTDNCKTTDPVIKLAALLHDIGKPDAYAEDEEGHGHFYGHPKISAEIAGPMLKKQLRLSNANYERAMELIEFHDDTPAPTVKAVRRAAYRHGAAFMCDWFILRQADMDDHIYPDSSHTDDMNTVKELFAATIETQLFTRKDLAINGKDLMSRLGLKPGRQIGRIIETLVNEAVDGNVANNKKALLARAAQIIEREV